MILAHNVIKILVLLGLAICLSIAELKQNIISNKKTVITLIDSGFYIKGFIKI